MCEKQNKGKGKKRKEKKRKMGNYNWFAFFDAQTKNMKTLVS